MTDRLITAQGREIAHVRTPGQGPEICFLPGLRSDMEGTKVVHLEAWAKAQGRAFLRFDYSGHGISSGDFLDGSIGDWAEDAEAVIFSTPGKKLLVGSSMGGWISLLLARKRPEDVAGVVLIAPAPDFCTGAKPWPARDPAAVQAELDRAGCITMPSDYGEPMVFTRRLIEDAVAHRRVLGLPLALPFPVRILHGTHDKEVPTSVSRAILDQAEGEDIVLTLVKGADHRFSRPAELKRIEGAVAEVLGL